VRGGGCANYSEKILCQNSEQFGVLQASAREGDGAHRYQEHQTGVPKFCLLLTLTLNFHTYKNFNKVLLKFLYCITGRSV
jgi:hypothetical protein